MSYIKQLSFILSVLVFMTSIDAIAQATVQIEVDWNNFSEENVITFRNPATATLGTICDPTCGAVTFADNTFDNIAGPASFNVPYATGYSLFITDAFGDGWENYGGGPSYVRVYVDGVEILQNFPGNFGANTTITFDVVLPPAELSITDISVNENAGTADLSVNHTGSNTSGSFTVDYTTANNSAITPGDYTATGSPAPTITFSGTSPETQTLTIPISIIDDNFAEATESFFVNLVNISDPSINITDGQGEITINDNDNASITINDVTVNEGDGTATLTLTLSGANVSGGFSVPYTLANGSATNPADYTTVGATASPINFAGNINETQQITIPIIDDSDLETDHNFFVNLGATSSPLVTIGDPQGEITIQDNDTGISIADIFVNENAGTATFQVTQIGSNTGPFSVDYTTTDNTAIAGLDYITNTSTLNFSGTTGEIINVVVTIVDNTYIEVNETFNLILSNPSDPSITLDNAIATIIDDPGDTPIQANVPLTLFDEFNGYYDYAVTGDSFRNSTVNECSIIGATTGTTLTTAIPVGATIEKAYLFWAHSSASPDESVTFEGQTVNASIIRSSSFGGANLYGMTSDVTTLIQGIPNLSTNTFDFSNLTIDNGEPYCSSTVVLGGWSLMIFYTAPALPAVSINLYNGFDGQQNNSNSYNLTGFFAIGASGSKTTILSWEGDQGLANNESLTVTTGSGTFNLSGDGGQTGGNPFNSTVYDNTVGPVVNRTTLGLDLDTYDISAFIGPGESTVTTNVGVGQDFVISNAVLLKVPSNLIIGNVFEDINYGGGNGRNLATSSGAPIVGATVELYDNTGTFVESTTTDTNGQYSIGGMQNGTYSVRVVNSTVRSTRGGGAACTTCYPVQTYRRNYAATVFTDVTTEIGGATPSQQDVATGTLTGAQSISSITILSEGVVGMDFGFNFNTVVNTNESGQGSLEQFIVNSNNLDETGLDIEANSIFNPASGEDTSVFMIPPTGDSLGRTADANFANGYFDITISNGSNLSTITDANTHIDARTQTAYSNTNTGTIGSGGSTVGVSGNILPNYDLPEIQVHRNNGDVLRIQGSNTVIRGLSVYAGNNSGIILESGSSTIDRNLIGVNADGLSSGNIDYGIEITGGTSVISNSYIASNTDAGILINGGTSTTIEDNQIASNGLAACNDNITIQSGSGVIIQQNLIENSAAMGIDGAGVSGNISITENTIQNSGQHGGSCSGSIENTGIRLEGNNSSITSNIIANNGGAGVVITGGNTSGNLISQNSIYNNGTSSPALGIDIDQATTGNPVGDGITINDANDSDAGPNGSLNFPIFESIVITGNRLRVSGWSRPGATLEFFVTDISQGTASTGDNQLGLTQDYGEGQVYLGSAVEGSGSDQASGTSSYSDPDGNADTTNRFSFEIILASSYPAGTLITATATLSNSTSEFSNTFPIGAKTVITNRRITYRVKPN